MKLFLSIDSGISLESLIEWMQQLPWDAQGATIKYRNEGIGDTKVTYAGYDAETNTVEVM